MRKKQKTNRICEYCETIWQPRPPAVLSPGDTRAISILARPASPLWNPDIVDAPGAFLGAAPVVAVYLALSNDESNPFPRLFNVIPPAPPPTPTQDGQL